jgi:hypothetical protein
MTEGLIEKDTLPKEITYIDIYNMLLPHKVIGNIDPDYIKERAVKNLTEYGFGKRLQEILRNSPEGKKLEEIFSSREEVYDIPAFPRTISRGKNRDFTNNKSLLVPTEEGLGIIIISDSKDNPLKIHPDILQISRETATKYEDELGEILEGEIHNLEMRTTYLDNNMKI